MRNLGPCAFLVFAIIGCSSEKSTTVSKPPQVSARLVNVLPSQPGQPIPAPASRPTEPVFAKSSDAAYVFFEILEDGEPVQLSGSHQFSGTLRFSDKVTARVSLATPSLSTVQMIAIPAGYSEKPKSAQLDLILSGSDKPIATFPLENLPEPTKAIKDSESRMANPRWIVSFDPKTSQLAVASKNRPAGMNSRISLLRGNSVDFTKSPGQPSATLSDQSPGPVAFYRDIYGLTEVELEESLSTTVTETASLVAEGLEVEEVFKTPVLNVPKAISTTTQSGFIIEIPKQRTAPFRQGRGSSNVAYLKIGVRRSDKVSPDLRSDQMVGFTLDTFSLDLGPYGIGELQLSGDRSVLGSSPLLESRNSILFKGAGAIKPGKLPSLSITVTYRVPKKVGIYKGIVPVTR